MNAIVSLRQLSKIYGAGETEVRALDDVSLDIEAGEFLALMGPSGSGKSTLLHIIAGIDRPTKGECHVQGIDVAKLNESQLADWRNQNVGFIFQTFNLIPVLTAAENVELPLLLTAVPPPRRREMVATALDLVGLSDRARHLPRQLSGGQEQRVGIARAIVTDPKLIVADEPTGNLDAHSAESILEILRALSCEVGKTVIMVTHDPRAAGRGNARAPFGEGPPSAGGGREPPRLLRAMSLGGFIFRNAVRNKRRSCLTVGSVAVSLFLFVTLQVATREMTIPPEM